MIATIPLLPDRVRKIQGSFAFIQHIFLRKGYWQELSQHGLLLYFFLVLVGDRQGLSFYNYDKICSLLGVCLEEYILARDELIDKDLIAFDGRVFQVLSLPDQPVKADSNPLRSKEDMRTKDPATIRQIISQELGVK